MSTITVLESPGLQTTANPYSSVAKGALTTADNVIVKRQGVIESRRGQVIESTNFGARPAATFTFFGGGKVVQDDSGKVWYNTSEGATYSQYTGTYATVDATSQRMKWVEAQKNLYFNTSTGLCYLEALTSNPLKAGIPRAIDLYNQSATVPTPPVTGFLAAGSSVAYRVVYGLKDANGNLKLGVPTGRCVVTNSSTTTAATTSFTIYFPSEVSSNPTKYFYRVYRSRQVEAAAYPPDDEMFLVREASVTDAAGASFYVYTDTTPELMLPLGDPLYTNPKTGDGILASNFPPPVAKDITLWQESVWYANTSGPQRFSLQMLGTGGPDGVQSGDKLAIGKRVYSAGSTFALTTGGAADKNVLATATEFASQINIREISGGYVTPGLFAYYASADNETSGKIQLEGASLATSQFHVAASRPASWNPVLPQLQTVVTGTRVGTTVTLTTALPHGNAVGDQVWVATDGETSFDPNYAPGLKTITSVNTTYSFKYEEVGTTTNLSLTGHAYYTYKAYTTNASDNAPLVNGITYSKFQEPEACPLTNYLYVGAKNSPILRIAPLKDKLFVFKAEGIYVVSGAAGQYRVDLLDNTAKLIAPDTVCSLNNQLYALTTQGVVSVSDSGVGIISRGIESDLRLLFVGSNYETVKAAAWAYGYESERMLYLGTYFAGMYVFNLLTRAWTRFTTDRTFSRASPVDDALWFSSNTSARLLKEMRTYSDLDYVDDLRQTSVVTGSTGSGMVTIGASYMPNVGDVLVSDAGEYRLVTAVDVNSGVATLNGAALANGTYNLKRAIKCVVEYSPIASGSPGVEKQFSEAQFHLMPGNVRSLTTSFRTDHATSATSPVVVNASYAFLSNPAAEPRNVRVLVPREKQRGTMIRLGLTICEALSTWALLGFSVEVDGYSTKDTR